MKAWILALTIFFSLSSSLNSVYAQDQEATVLLSQKHIQVNTFETTFLRNSSSPRRVIVTAPQWITESVCQAYDTRRVTYPCNGQCYNQVICTGYGQRRQCRTVYTCMRTMCSRIESYCSRYESVARRAEKTIKFVFRSPKKLKPGHEEKYYLTTASQENINGNPTLEAENAACNEIIKRRSGGKFVIKLNKGCE
jgi:hypothetical protein